MSFITTTQGQIQDFLKGGSNLQRGFHLLILTDYLLIFLKILHENEMILSQKGFGQTPSGSATATIEKWQSY